MKVLDNSMVNIELMPGKTGEEAQADVKEQAAGAAGTAQAKTGEAQAQATSTASGYAETAKQKAAGYQEQATGYQQQSSETVKGLGDSVEKSGPAYVKSGSEAANSAVEGYLPESMQQYGGAAVGYGSNLATGTVGTVAGGVKDLGDTVGNASYSTVAGAGKTGYNLASGLGGALAGKKPGTETAAEVPEAAKAPEAETTEAPAAEEEVTKVAEDVEAKP